MLGAPATGLRYRETGDLTNVGTIGEYWSSSSYAAGDAYVGRLLFSEDQVMPLDVAARSSARPVRCVQHLQKQLGPGVAKCYGICQRGRRFSNPLPR